VEFPLSTACPSGIHRGTHRALVDSINLHLAHLLAHSPVDSESERIAQHVRSIALKLRNSDAPPIDEEDALALQTVKAKVDKIVVILRAILPKVDRIVMADIISQLCLPKNDSAAELSGPRVIAMMSFVDEVYRIFDDSTVTPWVLIWPKILWHAPQHRSAVLRHILGVAKFSAGLLRKMQPLLMPFFVGIGSQTGHILECTPEDQALAVSVLFYMDHNWTNISAKVAPLLGSCLADSAKELLIDVLLNKDTTGDVTKLQLLLLLLQSDAGVRKAASFTHSVPNNWEDLGLPLAHHARKMSMDRVAREERGSDDGSTSSPHWLAYLLSCARSQTSAQCATTTATENTVDGKNTRVLRDILRCISLCPKAFDASDFVRALYEITPAVVSLSDIYERACKLSFVTGNARVLEALILDKKEHEISTESWGTRVDISLDCDETFDEHVLHAVSKATLGEMRKKLASWDLALLPML